MLAVRPSLALDGNFWRFFSRYDFFLFDGLPEVQYSQNRASFIFASMQPEPLILSTEEKLRALRELDVFHRWDSIDERRHCRNCGKTITGREIKVFADPRGDHPRRLECPTKGCLSVPLEWIILEPAKQSAGYLPAPISPEATTIPPRKPGWNLLLRRSSIFGFLRAPQVFFQ